MPEPTYTRLSGYHPTGSEVNFGDRLFNGSPQLNPALRTAASGVPYVGPAYTGVRAINEFLHFLGRQGTFGKPQGPSTPTAGSPAAVGPVGGAAPQGPGAFAGDPTDPNNPANYKLGSPGETNTTAPANNGYDLNGIIRGLWQTGRVTGAPAFSATRVQRAFPGSAIGPFGGGTTNPYDPKARTPMSYWGTGLSGTAADAFAEVRRKNLI